MGFEFGGSAKARDLDKKSQDYLDEIIGSFRSVKAPEIQVPDAVPYQNLAPLGTPEAIQYSLDPAAQTQASLAGPSAFEGVKSDPRLGMTQTAALAALDNISRSGGLTPQDLAVMNRLQGDVAQADKGRREAILQNMKARGMSGSGQELLAQLQSGQAATDRASQAGMDQAGIASQRALDAILQSGNLAGSMRDQDFGEKSQIAQAQDAITKFNTANLNQIGLSNTGALNDFAARRASGNMGAQQANVGNALEVGKFRAQGAQAASNANTDLVNRLREIKANQPQQRFENELRAKTAQSDALSTGMGFNKDRAKQEADRKAREEDTLIKLGTSLFTYGAGAKK